MVGKQRATYRAYRGYNNAMLATIYRIGPIQVVPLMIAWTATVSSFTDSRDDWASYPVLGMLAAVALWHFALIATQKTWANRGAYFGYALLHIPVFVLVAFYCLLLITKDGP